MKRFRTVSSAEGPTFRQEEALFTKALRLPIAARARFLAAACIQESTLRDRVAALLQAHDQAGRFLDPPEVFCWRRRRSRKRARAD
jgi:hypothetical protein